MRLRITPVFAVPALLACAGGDASPAAVETRDSAGVRIVVNPDVALPTWSVDTLPRVDIGADAGREGADLFRVRGATRLSDGTIVVANGGTNEVRYYGPDGALLASAGRAGQAPGEFRRLAGVARIRGDTVLATDVGQYRLTRFDARGPLLGTVPYEGMPSGGPLLVGVLGDSLPVFRERRTAPIPQRGSIRDTTTVHLLRSGGEWVDLPGRHPGPEDVYVMENDRLAFAARVPFTSLVHVGAGHEQIWVGESEAYEIRGFGADGALRTIVRLARLPVPVTADDEETYFRGQEAMEGNAEWAANAREHLHFPTHFPAYAGLVADAEEGFWVQEYALPETDHPTRWRAFDGEGVAVAEIATPADLRVLEVGADYVLGVHRDSMDVEHVRLHVLRRSGL